MNKDNVTPSDMFIKAVCDEYGINKKWLKTGEGNIYIERTREQQIGAFANEVASALDTDFRKRFVLALTKLNENQWKILEEIVDSISKEG